MTHEFTSDELYLIVWALTEAKDVTYERRDKIRRRLPFANDVKEDCESMDYLEKIALRAQTLAENIKDDMNHNMLSG